MGRPAVIAALVPYIIAVAYVGGWFRAQKLGIAAGLARLDGVVWLPFFYQYYAPYTSTMSSAIVHVALYAPVGVFVWLWSRHRDRVPLRRATVLAVLLALVAETSKVFLSGRSPDYTDVFIAAVSATLALAVLRLGSRSQHLPRNAPAGPHSDAAKQPRDASRRDAPAVDSTAPPAATAGARVVGALLLLVAAVTVIGFPVGSWLLMLGLVFYAAVMLRYPTTAYLIAIPLLLPVLDLAPLSGRFFWDEFDLSAGDDAGRATADEAADAADSGSDAESGALAAVRVGHGEHGDRRLAARAGRCERVFELLEHLQRAAHRQGLCLGGRHALAHVA